jgi:hypothetical protein
MAGVVMTKRCECQNDDIAACLSMFDPSDDKQVFSKTACFQAPSNNQLMRCRTVDSFELAYCLLQNRLDSRGMSGGK